MAKRTRAKSVKFSLVNPHAAGIDVGSRSHWVCAGEGQTKEYKVFTEDLHEMAKWLKSLGIQTIAMESTGFYWKSLFLLLQDYGFEVILVHAAHVKNVRGKLTPLTSSMDMDLKILLQTKLTTHFITNMPMLPTSML